MPAVDNYIFTLSENVVRKPVSYKNRYGITLAGDLYLPKDMDETKQYPALIIGAPLRRCERAKPRFVRE